MKFEVSASSEFYRLFLRLFQNGSQLGIFQVRNFGKCSHNWFYINSCLFLSNLNHLLFTSLIKLQNKEKCIFFCAFTRALIVWPLTEASFWWFFHFRSRVEFVELFSKFKKRRNLRVTSRFLSHPRLFLDEKWTRLIFWPCATCHIVVREIDS